MRSLSVTASCLSIAAGLVAFYLYVSMRVKVFRHHLILLLLMFDFGKALVLLWYPARVLLVPSAYNNVNFCDVVGFFTSAFIEGADMAVLALAIHTALLIFMKSNGKEGGLYRYRYYVYAINILIPLIMAALAFADSGRSSYAPLITWCYLPIKPRWLRLALSWVPRYSIFIAIIAIYVSIYIYVKLEYQKVMKEYKKSQTYLEEDSNTNTGGMLTINDLMDPAEKPSNNVVQQSKSESYLRNSEGKFSLRKPAKFLMHSVLRFISYFPGFSFLEPSRLFSSDVQNNEMLDARSLAIREFQKDTLAKFQARRNNIERQIRSIFVYPVAYVFLWMAPFAVHILQYNYELHHGPVYWIGAIAAWMQPFNCVVDTVAFCIREKPWRDRKERIFTHGNLYWLRNKFCCCCYTSRVRTPQNKQFQNTTRHDRFNSSESTTVSTSSHINEMNETPNYKPNALTSFDNDLERFASQQINHSYAPEPEYSTSNNAMRRSRHDETKSSTASTIAENKRYNRQPTFDDHAFLTTAKRAEFEEKEISDDEGSMDLMEFLR